MNFVFVSPNFPESYRLFAARLKDNGINVLGIGDCPSPIVAAELMDISLGDDRWETWDYEKVRD
jgi:hypothetical protein